jgi:hypothetical protein
MGSRRETIETEGRKPLLDAFQLVCVSWRNWIPNNGRIIIIIIIRYIFTVGNIKRNMITRQLIWSLWANCNPDTSGAGAGFPRILRFPLPIFILPISPQSLSINHSRYNRPVVAAVPKVPPHELKRILTRLRDCRPKHVWEEAFWFPPELLVGPFTLLHVSDPSKEISFIVSHLMTMLQLQTPK